MKAGGQLSGTLVHASLDYSHGKQKQKQNKKSSGEVFIPHMARDKELVIGRREEKKSENEREKSFYRRSSIRLKHASDKSSSTQHK